MNISIRIYKDINNKLPLNAILIDKCDIYVFFLVIKLSRLDGLEDIIFVLISIFFKSRIKGSNIKFSIYLIFIISIPFRIFIVKFIGRDNYEKGKIEIRDFLYR